VRPRHDLPFVLRNLRRSDASAHAVGTRALARLALCSGDDLLSSPSAFVDRGALLEQHPSAVVDSCLRRLVTRGVEVVVPGEPNDSVSTYDRCLCPTQSSSPVTPSPLSRVATRATLRLSSRRLPITGEYRRELEQRLDRSATKALFIETRRPSLKKLFSVCPSGRVVDLTEARRSTSGAGFDQRTTTVVDLAPQTIVRWRIPWPDDVETDLAALTCRGRPRFDVERPTSPTEAVTLQDLPRRLAPTMAGEFDVAPIARQSATGPLSVFADRAHRTGSSARAAERGAHRGRRGPSVTVHDDGPRGFVSVGSATTYGCSARIRTPFEQ